MLFAFMEGFQMIKSIAFATAILAAATSQSIAAGAYVEGQLGYSSITQPDVWKFGFELISHPVFPI